MTKKIATRVIMSVALVFMTVLFDSCEKTEKIQTFDDVFDLTGINNLNNGIMNAGTTDELDQLFGNPVLSIPKELEKLSLRQMINHYSEVVSLSEAEIDLLLKNDSRTYIAVINRMGSLPKEIEDVKFDFTDLKNSPLSEYLLKQKESTDNFYINDYYSAVVAMQNYIKSNILLPMNTANDKFETIIPGGSGATPKPNISLLYFKLIVINNNWDMWWAYWSDGTRTKHRGANGMFPG